MAQVQHNMWVTFGREGRLGMRTIRITATGENRFHNIVKHRQPRQRQWTWSRSKPSSARTGRGALIVQTLLTVQRGLGPGCRIAGLPIAAWWSAMQVSLSV